MKELSIKEKSERYDEAIDRANSLLSSNQLGNAWIYKLLPELKKSKESEDERIRKALTDYFVRRKSAGDIDETWCGIPYDTIIAWLEKQSEHANFRNKIQIGDKVTRNEDGVLINLSQLNRVAKKDEKQSKNDMGISEATKKKLEDNLHNALEKETPESWNEFLDEQGEQKPIDKIQLGKKYKCIASPRYSTFMIGEIYKPEDKFLCSLMNFCSDCFEPIEDGEQKPVDKVEPKFKIGDKIIEKDFNECGYGTIIDIKDGKYIFDDGSFICIEEQGLWQLVEQKLAWSEEDETTLISILACIKHCQYEDMEAQYNGNHNVDPKRYDSMSDWLKSLKNRVQPQPKQEWSEEDARLLDNCISLIEDIDCTKEEQTFLKSIKERFGYEANCTATKEWSKEDEDILNTIINHFKVDIECTDEDDVVRWLKSLKDRYTWKPSDEQMHYLSWIANVKLGDSVVEQEVSKHLNELYEDLKKLRKE